MSLALQLLQNRCISSRLHPRSTGFIDGRWRNKRWVSQIMCRSITPQKKLSKWYKSTWACLRSCTRHGWIGSKRDCGNLTNGEAYVDMKRAGIKVYVQVHTHQDYTYGLVTTSECADGLINCCTRDANDAMAQYLASGCIGATSAIEEVNA